MTSPCPVPSRNHGALAALCPRRPPDPSRARRLRKLSLLLRRVFLRHERAGAVVVLLAQVPAAAPRHRPWPLAGAALRRESPRAQRRRPSVRAAPPRTNAARARQEPRLPPPDHEKIRTGAAIENLRLIFGAVLTEDTPPRTASSPRAPADACLRAGPRAGCSLLRTTPRPTPTPSLRRARRRRSGGTRKRPRSRRRRNKRRLNRLQGSSRSSRSSLWAVRHADRPSRR